MLKRWLKACGYSYRRIRKMVKGTPNAKDYALRLTLLYEFIAQQKRGELRLYFADESGFSLQPSVSSGWQLKNEPLGVVAAGHSKRLNVFGILHPNGQLHAWTSQKAINSDFIILAIDAFVAHLQPTEQRIMIVFDQAPIHRSKKLRAKLDQWSAAGVDLFCLPTYSPHLNLIETLWRKMKYEHLLPQHFVCFETLKEQVHHLLRTYGQLWNIHFKTLLTVNI